MMTLETALAPQNALDSVAWAALADSEEEQGRDGGRFRKVARLLEMGTRVLNAGWESRLKRQMDNRKKGRVFACPALSVDLVDNYWQEGSITRYCLYDIIGGKVLRNLTGTQPFTPLTGFDIKDKQGLEPGSMVLSHGTSRGKQASLVVFAHPLDLPTLCGYGEERAGK